MLKKIIKKESINLNALKLDLNYSVRLKRILFKRNNIISQTSSRFKKINQFLNQF